VQGRLDQLKKTDVQLLRSPEKVSTSQINHLKKRIVLSSSPKKGLKVILYFTLMNDKKLNDFFI
jgi:hypothetical protein